jgi:hypothetical protein
LWPAYSLSFSHPPPTRGDQRSAQEIADFSIAKTSGYKTPPADYTQTMNVTGSQMNMNG